MADTQTTNLKLVDQTTGGNSGTWGDIVDANWEKLDAKAGDVTSLSLSGGTTVLTETQERVNLFKLTGTLTSNAEIEFSGRGGAWIVDNQTSGDFTVTCLVNGQTGVVITQGETVLIYCDGTDVSSAGGVDQALNFLATEVSVASSGTTDVLGAASVFVEVTGTTTITSFGTGADRLRIVRFASTPTVTHNATSLICPGAANLAMAAGDVLILVSDSSSNVRVINVMRAGGILVGDLKFTATDKVAARSSAGAGKGEEVTLNAVGRSFAGDLTDPNADRIPFWDDGAGNIEWLTPGTGLEISGTSLQVKNTDLVYAGSSASNTTFPVGTNVAVWQVGGTPSVNRAGSATVRLDTTFAYRYTLDGAGSALTGTWRSRGVSAIPGPGSNVTYIFQRVA